MDFMAEGQICRYYEVRFLIEQRYKRLPNVVYIMLYTTAGDKHSPPFLHIIHIKKKVKLRNVLTTPPAVSSYHTPLFLFITNTLATRYEENRPDMKKYIRLIYVFEFVQMKFGIQEDIELKLWPHD